VRRSILPIEAAGLGVLALALSCVWAGEAKDADMAEATRSRESRFVHRITLLDEAGKALTAESTAPYSPRQTCSSSNCHDVDLVCKGTHSRMFPAAKPDPKRPAAHVWTVFDAATGVAAPLSGGFLPARGAPFDPKAQMTPFDLARLFGQFHPGGGRFERDADGQRYDKRMAEDDKLKASDNPDYAGTRWDQSGVLENDCLVCHALAAYDHVERAAELDKRNFKWAATVGAGLGTLEGRGESRKIKYNAALFDGHGKVLLDVGRPPDANCLACHRRPVKVGARAQAKLSGVATWRDGLSADVHSLSGLACVDCHTCGADHLMFGDRRLAEALRNPLNALAHAPLEQDPGFAALTCEGCHDSGRFGSVIPEHEGLPRLHLDKITCEACHAGPRPRSVPLALQQPSKVGWDVPVRSKTPNGPAVWTPVFAKDEAGKVRPYLRMLPAYYANRTEAGLVPLEPRKLKSRFRRAKGLKDDDGDGTIEVNTEAEIQAVLKAITRKGVQPVYLAGGMAYELDDQGQLKSEPNPLSNPIDVPLAHNVRPAGQSLGAQGCTECHGADSPFYQCLALTRELGSDGKPEGEPTYAVLGKTECDVWLGAVREDYIRPYGPLVVALTVLALLLHYVLFGPQRTVPDDPNERVTRLNWFERLVHFGLLGTFVVLAITGLMIAAGGDTVLGLGTTLVHETASWILVGAGVLAFLMWVRDMIFARYDWGWVKVLGGYLGYTGHVPAGRFNAGQKFFFWFIGLVVLGLAATGWVMMFEAPAHLLPLAYTLHELLAYVMILNILGHIYLGTLANPGCVGAIFEGKVTRAWLKHHHPNYEPKDHT